MRNRDWLWKIGCSEQKICIISETEQDRARVTIVTAYNFIKSYTSCQLLAKLMTLNDL